LQTKPVPELRDRRARSRSQIQWSRFTAPISGLCVIGLCKKLQKSYTR